MASPNIVFLHSHNTGKHIQPYGYAVPTPNMQKLADEGVLFRRAFAAAPTCSPSRASFLTGQCPHSAGMLGLAHRGFGLNDIKQHIASVLAEQGYHTMLCGVEHTTAFQTGTVGPAYETVIELEKAYAKDVGPQVSDFINAYKDDKPFFISAGLQETHVPFPDPDPENYPAEDERYCMPPAPLPDVPGIRKDTAGFKASARHMDDAFGKILDALDESGKADNTLVFCFADHGLQFARHMANLTDTGLEVYFIARGPKTGPASTLRGGKVVDAMVSLMDMFPTACDASGFDKPGWLQGESLLPLVDGKVDKLHDELFGELTFHAAPEPMRCVRTERYKYIRRYDAREKLVRPNADDTNSKSYLLEQGWDDQPREQEMLYDLVFDPFETNNLIDKPDMKSVLDDLKGRLENWMKRTSDPLLESPATLGEGMKYNHPDNESWHQPFDTVPQGKSVTFGKKHEPS